MGKDVGTSILTGATAERFEIVKWFYIEADDDTGFDAAADLIARAVANLHPAVAGGTRDRQAEPGEVLVMRDLLDDIAAVLHADRWDAPKIPAADIPARLRTLAPDWAPYRTINGPQIRRYLDTEHGIKCPPPAAATPSTRPRSATPSPVAAPPPTRTVPHERAADRSSWRPDAPGLLQPRPG
jgi:DNA segregation ATPase FtsK/SpoIIIE, S-DNA-T family